MGKTEWTQEQWQAITEKDCTILVAAAAGAGKTAVLVERIIRKITNPDDLVDIDSLLVVTFTNAAATEMRKRIGEAIMAVLEKNPDSQALHRQLSLLNKASISTIHSFCLEVIRSNFSSLNIDPGFRIADETEATLMKLEILKELFEDQYEREENEAKEGETEESQAEEFFKLLECYGGNRDDHALQEIVLNLYHFIQSCPWPEKWLEQMLEKFNVSPGSDFGETSWGQVLLQSVRCELEGLAGRMSRAIGIIEAGWGLEKYLSVFCEDLANLETLLKVCSVQREQSWDRVFRMLHKLEFSRLPSAGKEADKEKKETVKKIRDDVKARIKYLKTKLFTSDSTDTIEDMKTMYPRLRYLVRLVLDFSERYSARKSQKAVVDFNDLEHFCLKILSEEDEQGEIRPSAIALGYKKRFQEIYVDEYQDSNLVQEIIIKLISRDEPESPNVFLVGDVKQSIYRFRQAKPELFLEKYNTYSREQGDLRRKILLLKNFRCRTEIVTAVNFIFSQIMSVTIGELDYTELEALNSGAVFVGNEIETNVVGGKTEFHLIQTEVGDEFGFPEDPMSEEAYVSEGQEINEAAPDDEEMLDSIQCEARLVAKRILELRQPDKQGRMFCVFDKELEEYRKVEYRDIVVLLRTTRKWSGTFLEELAAQGIPAFADTGLGFFKTPEVQVILSLLQIIDNPLQDIPLLAVLRSPLVSFTTDELVELRLADRKAALYQALKVLAAGKLSQGNYSQAADKAAAFLEKLQRWRDIALYLPTDQLLWQLYNETGYYGIIGAMPAGEQRQANLRILFERARQFEETSYKGLFNFINFIDRLKSSKGEMGSAKILGENENVVRIMSIHKSKGLEFPVVILSGCGKKFNLQDMNKSILLHQELGFGPDIVDSKLRLSYPSLPKQAIREKIKTETLSEEMRILYVALTRAREKLIITGTVSDIPKVGAKWLKTATVSEDKLSTYEMVKGWRYLDWLGPALLRHQDCGILRERAGSVSESEKGFSGLILEDSSSWSVRLWNKNDVLSSKITKEYSESEFCRWLAELHNSLDKSEEEDKSQDRFDEEAGPEKQDSLDEENRNQLPEGRDSGELPIGKESEETGYEFSAEITRRLSWEYPYARISKVPAKVSVTELKRRFEAEMAEGSGILAASIPVLVKKPKFLEEKIGLSAAETGAILHFVLQYLDFQQEDLEVQIEEMITKDLLSEQQAQSIDVVKIRTFLESPLGKRMLASEKVSREIPFNIEILCQEVYKELVGKAYKNETLLLQGVIDCYFEEEDGLVLLDYKTDYVAPGRADLIRERYTTQINYYAWALEKLTEKKVKDKLIYLFSNGEVLEY
ncbi:MAG: helicase-exonuclease AddAB subunit AddA [Desulfitobacteriaceae bacterium]|nr:helicase-exonuclease AddAB subunit AddA [Desulfitobacteriaceae bacterium]MDD4345555.1 helicase-exonuclease AddAB subunit AddA [Desulfitobacteriaceae bacterium]MDD4401218.1 helicase-exonuclease AddAB subunit AddA [Desulfitobacteriaceae bacterium]